MRILGFNLTKISIERKEKMQEKVNIKSNIEIKDLEKDSIDLTKQEILKISFDFIVNYEPDFARLSLSGYIMTLPDSDELKKIMKSWKDKKVPEEMRIPLFNFIMTKCNLKALELEDELGLPLHVPMPRLSPQKQEE